MNTCLSESNWVELPAISLHASFLLCFLHYFRTGASSLLGSTAHHNGVAIRKSLLQEAGNAGRIIEFFERRMAFVSQSLHGRSYFTIR